MADTEACKAVLDYLLEHPEQHSQAAWFDHPKARGHGSPDEPPGCGTTMCVAGTAIWQAFGVHDVWSAEDIASTVMTTEDLGHGGWIEAMASALLGLTAIEGNDLFHMMDNADALIKLKEYANG